MTTFDRPSLLDNRYAAIAETSVFTYDDDDLVNYADFLRKHGRYMTKTGFVDSSRRIRSLQRQQDDLFLTQNRAAPSKTGLLATLNKTSFSGSLPTISVNEQKTRPAPMPEIPTVISVTTHLEAKDKEHDKQMRLIEEQIIKAKQTERESKRFDADLKKEQRHLQQTLKELDLDATKKRSDTEKSSFKNFDDGDRIEREFLKKRDLQTKYQIERSVDLLRTNQDRDRRSIMICNDLARQYRIKANQLEMAQQKINQLHSDFEQKVQFKQVEENEIKKELGELAMALNSEAQKAKREEKKFVSTMTRDQTKMIKNDLEQEKNFEQRLNETSIHVKNYDLERRRLSADVTVARSVLDLKQREALRKIVDTKNRLETIYSEQRQLNQSAAVAEQDRRASELMAKMADVETRRTQLMTQYLTEKVERSEEREAEGSIKAKVRYAENETRQHEDHLKHFQKVVVKNEEIEQDLKKSVKESEAERRKREEQLQRLQEEFNRKKREDAAKIREEIARAEREERILEENLLIEKSKLEQLHNQRGDTYARLIKQREQIRETKALLETHAREHERLLRVHARSLSIQTNETV